MSNCNTKSQGRIYTSILQGFPKNLVAVVYIEIHMLQTKEFACAKQVKTVQDTALQNKQKGRISIILSMHLFAGMAVYFIFFSVCYIFFFDKTRKTYVLISQFSTKISAVDFRLFLKNYYWYYFLSGFNRVTFSKTPLIAVIFLHRC